jgi:hypothetical protein
MISAGGDLAVLQAGGQHHVGDLVPVDDDGRVPDRDGARVLPEVSDQRREVGLERGMGLRAGGNGRAVVEQLPVAVRGRRPEVLEDVLLRRYHGVEHDRPDAGGVVGQRLQREVGAGGDAVEVPVADAEGRTQVRSAGTEPHLGGRLDLRADLVGDGLRGLRDRRLLSADPGLASRHHDETALVLDALEQAVWTRTRDGVGNLAGLICHHDAGSQYTSIAYTERLAQAGIDPSVGSIGDAYDNALAETVIGLFKTELIKPHGPWRTVEQVEIATLEYVDWFNHRRLFQPGFRS